AKKRFGLSILNYTITSNHIHLLVEDSPINLLPKVCSLSLVERHRNLIIAKKEKVPIGMIDISNSR
ncbi:hypothetical protein MNBD_GAMMA10-774, partial [hydrothermal vent metagenome]